MRSPPARSEGDPRNTRGTNANEDAIAQASGAVVTATDFACLRTRPLAEPNQRNMPLEGRQAGVPESICVRKAQNIDRIGGRPPPVEQTTGRGGALRKTSDPDGRSGFLGISDSHGLLSILLIIRPTGRSSGGSHFRGAVRGLTEVRFARRHARSLGRP